MEETAVVRATAKGDCLKGSYVASHILVVPTDDKSYPYAAYGNSLDQRGLQPAIIRRYAVWWSLSWPVMELKNTVKLPVLPLP